MIQLGYVFGFIKRWGDNGDIDGLGHGDLDWIDKGRGAFYRKTNSHPILLFERMILQ